MVCLPFEDISSQQSLHLDVSWSWLNLDQSGPAGKQCFSSVINQSIFTCQHPDFYGNWIWVRSTSLPLSPSFLPAFMPPFTSPLFSIISPKSPFQLPHLCLPSIKITSDLVSIILMLLHDSTGNRCDQGQLFFLQRNWAFLIDNCIQFHISFNQVTNDIVGNIMHSLHLIYLQYFVTGKNAIPAEMPFCYHSETDFNIINFTAKQKYNAYNA